MRSHEKPNTFRTVLLPLTLAVAVVASPRLIAQEKPSKGDQHSNHKHKSSQADKPLEEQLLELRATVARLEAALEQNHNGQPPPAAQGEHSAHHSAEKHKSTDSMKRRGAMKGMASMKDTQMGSMGSMASMKGMKMGAMGRGMSMMGKMSGISWSRSALPGFPGASHIYHIGATDFFLDHPEHITLATEQQAALNKLREQAMLKQSSFDRQIDGAEQQLWELTSADQPDAKKIETKIREIEKLRGDQRLAFIRSVGEAAKTLTEHQRHTLAGTASGGSSHTDAQNHKDER